MMVSNLHGDRIEISILRKNLLCCPAGNSCPKILGMGGLEAQINENVAKWVYFPWCSIIYKVMTG